MDDERPALNLNKQYDVYPVNCGRTGPLNDCHAEFTLRKLSFGPSTTWRTLGLPASTLRVHNSEIVLAHPENLRMVEEIADGGIQYGFVVEVLAAASASKNSAIGHSGVLAKMIRDFDAPVDVSYVEPAREAPDRLPALIRLLGAGVAGSHEAFAEFFVTSTDDERRRVVGALGHAAAGLRIPCTLCLMQPMFLPEEMPDHLSLAHGALRRPAPGE